MIKSMTGYGSAVGASGKLKVTIEIKSVNNRYLDTSIRMPRGYVFAEDAMTSTIKKKVSRGKVDVFVTIDASKSDSANVVINEGLAQGYIDALNRMSEQFSLKNDISVMHIARFQDVLSIENEEKDTDAITADFCRILEDALDNFNAMREREGKKLKADVLEHISVIKELTAKAEERSPKTVEEYRNRLTAKIQEVLENKTIDESRIITEAAIFADKVDVNEEVVRLKSHMDQLVGMLEDDIPVGRKLDFLIQEFNREANTMGSKGNDVEMARIVVDIKSEIEKIREQIQNIE